MSGGRGSFAALVSIAALVSLAVPSLAGPANPVPEGKARRGPYLFAAVPWLTAGDSLGARLGPRGYKENAAGRQKDRRQFEGRLFDHWAMVTGLLDDQGRLVRWEISVPAPAEEGRDIYASQRAIYDAAVAEMEAKYGARRSGVDQFRFPYQKDDGRGMRALGEGLATIRSEWVGRAGERLTVAMDERVSVTLVYESSKWAATEKERRRKKARDL